MFGAGPYKLNAYNETTGLIYLEKNTYFADWYGATPSFDECLLRVHW